ncbi:MAG: class I SAM-dependent methyltransferase [Anaerolineae bacterium]|nr:class I SAM-dependent methyltransferase [Anaerolineae bacterium]
MVENKTETYWDDPSRDFRQRYQLPEHYLWDPYALPAINYEGYIRIALSLLPSPQASVLDVGCGDGWVTNRMIKRGYQTVGIDYSDRAISFARLMVPEAEFHTGDIRDLDMQQKWLEKFDAALFVEVLEHIPPQYHLQLVSGINKCLKRNGTLVLTVPSVNRALNPWHYKHFTQQEGVDLLETTGFKVVNIVNQQESTFWRSKQLWRFLKNPIYDIRLTRIFMSRLLLRKYNIAKSPNKAERFIYQAEKI